MNPTLSLRDATVQEIQLELIRRRRFNDFDGERVCELLGRHRGLWKSVIFDRLGQLSVKRPGNLPMGGLIKLRDLEDNIWNVDHLFVLTHTAEGARALCVAFEEANIGAMPRVHEDSDEVDMALGTGGEQIGLLTVWWD